MQQGNITVVIVTWNNETDIVDCLQSVQDQAYPDFNILVVDNNSTDKTVVLVQKHFPQVDLQIMSKNLYLTGGNNFGISYAIEHYNPEYVLVLNPDTIVKPDLLSVLRAAIDSGAKIGAAGPKVKFLLGGGQSQDYGKINSAGLIYDGFLQAYDRGFLETDKGQFAGDEEVFGVTGACILLRVQMLNEIGLYWRAIKLHLDEVELFIRAQKAGWKAIYTGKTSIDHKWMRSTDQNKLYNLESAKKKAWARIALRHYPLKRKFAALKQLFLTSK